jgi:hypothetical protein
MYVYIYILYVIEKLYCEVGIHNMVRTASGKYNLCSNFLKSLAHIYIYIYIYMKINN